MTSQTTDGRDNLMEYVQDMKARWEERYGVMGVELGKEVDGLVDIMNIEFRETARIMVEDALEKHNHDSNAHLPIRSMVDGATVRLSGPGA